MTFQCQIELHPSALKTNNMHSRM